MKEINNDDVPYLLSAYSFAFFIAATVHVAVLALAAGSQSLSAAQIFWEMPSPFGSLHHLSAAEGVFSFLKYDLAIYACSTLVWCLYSVFEMRRQGYVTTAQGTTAALAVVISAFLFGPGAMYAGTWYWRENTIAALSERVESKESE